MDASEVARAMLTRRESTETPFLSDPVGWVETRLGEQLWSAQAEIARSVVDHRYTAVQSCHDSGKSFIASRLAAWWLDVHPPGEAFVVTTAPTAMQVSAILWREISKAHKKGRLFGRITGGPVPEWKLPDGEIIAYGRKPADYDPAAFQGIHARFVLVVIDEACGVPRQLFDAVDALATNEAARVLAIGNPDDPTSHFAEVCRPGSGWNTFHIDGLTTPNMTAELVAQYPRLAELVESEGITLSSEPISERVRPLLLSPLWVAERIDRWGTRSPLFSAKVRGRFPETGEDQLIPLSSILAAQQRKLEPAHTTTLGIDVARFGTDRTVMTVARGPVVRVVEDHAQQRTTETTGRAINTKAMHGVHEVRVEGVGVGAGVVDELLESGHDVVDMQPGAPARDAEHFANARAEWWWGIRQLFEDGDIDIDPLDDELASQLGAMRYTFTARGQIKIESKEDMRKRGLPSPDRADSLMLALADVMVPGGVIEAADLDAELERYSISPW